MSKKFVNKKGEKLSSGLFIVILTISISLFSFISEENRITGFAISGEKQEEIEVIQPDLIEFKDVNSLSTLAAGNYYIDGNGIVYWIDDESRPAIAKVNFVDESQKNRDIYIDIEGRIGYILEAVQIENEQ